MGSAPFVRRRCDCLASSVPFTNIQTYLLTYYHSDCLSANCHCDSKCNANSALVCKWSFPPAGSQKGHPPCIKLGVDLLVMEEVVVATGAVRCAKLQSYHCHQQINTQLFTGRVPFLSPNRVRGKMVSRSMDWLSPSSPWVFQLCLWPLKAPVYLGGRVAKPLVSSLMPVSQS